MFASKTEVPQQDLDKLFNSDEFEKCHVELADARHLPAYMYNAPEIFEREKRLLFRRDWLAVAREDMIPQPGDYMTMELAGESIVVSRDLDGQLAAFVNSCRHRGAPVLSGSGNAKDFSCPWHGWSYDVRGRLISAHRPRQMGNFDAKNCRMPELRIDSFGGFIFVNFDLEADSLAAYLDVDGFREEVAFLRSEELMTVDVYSYEIEANWKMVMETLADVYHVEVVHKETFGNRKTGYTPQTTSNVKLTKYGSRKLYSAATSSFGGEALFGPMPWLADHPSGKLFAMSFYLRPNMAFFARCDMVQPWVALPIAPNRTKILGWTCMPKAFKDMPAFEHKVKLIAEYAREQNNEDRELILALQRGTTSDYFPSGPLHELEALVHHRTKGYLRAMAGPGDAK